MTNKVLLRRLNNRNYFNIWLMVITIAAFGILKLTQISFDYNVQFVFVFVIFITVGLPHGAIDHYISKELLKATVHRKRTSTYEIRATLEMIAYGFLWVFFPVFSFIFFILMSAFHFGESQLYYCFENKPIKIDRYLVYTIWGLDVILTQMILKLDEVQNTLNGLFPTFTKNHQLYLLVEGNSVLLMTGLFFINLMAFLYLFIRIKVHWKNLLSEVLILAVLFFVFYSFPLYIGFVIYFGIWHSAKAIQQIFIFYDKRNLPLTVKKFYLTAFPYSAFSILIIISILLINYHYTFLENYLFLFFIIISVLTLPHFRIFSKMYSFK